MNFTIKTKGFSDFINITDLVKEEIKKSKIKDGIIFLFIKGTTACLTLLENEEGHLNDLKSILEKIAPEGQNYQHHHNGYDLNGASHIKASLFKQDLVLPITNGELDLGHWQNIFLIDFDNKPRQREIVIKIIDLNN